MEWWNGFFSHPFYLLVCLLIIILWLSFQFTCFYFQAILLCMCVFVANFNYKEQSNSKYSVMFYQELLLCVGNSCIEVVAS